MIDAHVEEAFKRKVQNFEYVDFSKLIVCNWTIREDEGHHRLEIINKNGFSYLVTTADHDNIQISSYACWKQAFRVYSNIITAKFLHKAMELLQYNHTIHTAAMSYIWKNVYAYDKEFRHHILRHVEHPWNVILQQACTMLLKDRLCNDNSFFQHGGGNGRVNKRDVKPCRHFNRGKCMYGLACKFNHCCSIKKCGKFGHGVHVCHLCGSESCTTSTTQLVQVSSPTEKSKDWTWLLV